MKTQLTLIGKAILWLLLSTLLIQPSTLFAQGTAFTYHGRLDDNGSPVTGPYTMTFTVWDDPSSGRQVGATTFLTAVPVSNGVFTVEIDPGADVFTGPPRWLEIGLLVDPNNPNTPLLLDPRQPITPTPYAIYSGKTMMLDGALPGSQLSGSYTNPVSINNSGNVFGGDGSGLENVDAAKLGGLTASGFWQLGGNTGTTAGTDFLGTSDNHPLELKVNGQRGIRLEYADDGFYQSVNVIAGDRGNYVGNAVAGATIGGGGTTDSGFTNRVLGSFGTVGGGVANTASSANATVSGGGNNNADGFNATVSGGGHNFASSVATVSGGQLNGATAFGATVGGGEANTASFDYATVSGGRTNTASGPGATVSGGNVNTASGNDATVGGGEGNTASFSYATVSGGYFNTNSSSFGAVGGGYNNTASGYAATVGGGVLNTASGSRAMVSGGQNNTASGDYGTVSGGFLNTNSAYAATVGGGQNNTASGLYATIGGGFTNTAIDNFTTIGGGINNFIASRSTNATIGGGIGNHIGPSCDSATVSGGHENTMASNAWEATICGGGGNNADASLSVVGGGAGNKIHEGAQASVIPGGALNEIGTNAYYSFAAGRKAKANHQGVFIWADNTASDFTSDRARQFKVRAYGGVQFESYGIGLNPPAMLVDANGPSAVGLYVFQTSSDATAVFENRGTGDQIKVFNGPGSQVFWVNNGGDVYAKSYNTTSDRHAKENFKAINPLDVLAKVVSLPISRWNFKKDTVRHMGPMAQDFHAAFGLNGTDDKHIATVDADGVALAAIQGLNQKLEATRAELKRRDAENAELKQELTELEHFVHSFLPQAKGGAR
jgi:trimeric autotransporter adhesin